MVKTIIRKTVSLLKKNYFVRLAYRYFFREIYNKLRFKRKLKKIFSVSDHEQILKSVDALDEKPLFSVLVPVYNVPPEWLNNAVASVKNQLYPNWELCLVDDCSTSEKTLEFLHALERENDSRIKIKFLEKNLNISGASNEAAAIASGDYFVLLDNDDELTPDALYELALCISKTGAEFVYSDECVVSVKGTVLGVNFKPDYSPDLLLSQNYICHISAVKKEIFFGSGAFRLGYEGSQDHDLFLRVVEKTDKIFHIPKVLYKWKAVPGSTADKYDSKSYAWNAQKQATVDALERRNIKGKVELGKFSGTCRVMRDIPGSPLVSIIIPFKDQPGILKQCLDSILTKSTYTHYEIIGISNNSSDTKTFDLMKEYGDSHSNITFYEYNVPFNYSKINNYGATLAKGEHLVLLNNDIEIISPGWIEALLEHSQRSDVGAVGAKLYYPDGIVQHGGIIVGLGGVAAHSHRFFVKDAPGYYYRLNLIQDLSAVTAACLMVEKKLYERLGGLEEELTVAYNDLDFCLRLRELGLLNIFTPYCEAYHYESKSRGSEDTPEKKKRLKKEMEYIWKRHPEIFKNGDPYYNPNLTLTREDFSIR